MGDDTIILPGPGEYLRTTEVQPGEPEGIPPEFDFGDPPPSVAEMEAIPRSYEPPPPHELRSLFRREAADRAELLLARLARARGAVDLAIAEGLAALCVGDRLAVLCCSSIGDYGRERLGVSERTAQGMARLARELHSRPILRAAVWAGEVTIRKAETVLSLAKGDAEEAWVERARTETVRALEKAVREAGAPAEEDDEWGRLRTGIEPEDRAKLDRALWVAGRLLGPTTTRWQRLEAIGQEYLGSHPVQEAPMQPGVFRFPPRGVPGLEERLEQETECWAFLSEPAPRAVEDRDLSLEKDPKELDSEILALKAKRVRWDAAIGWLALVVKRSKIWRYLGFATFAHYCSERLGLAHHTVEQRVALEERLWELPALRDAMTGGLSYEKARLVARCPDDQVGEAIQKAWELTCIRLRRHLQAEQDRQMCARRVLTTPVPRSVALVLDAAFRSVRAQHGWFLPTGKCLGIISEEFVATWEPTVPRAKTPSMKARERDGCLCCVPGCSRPAANAHHVRFRSHGGGNELTNLLGLCLFHHLRCLHKGYMTLVREGASLFWFYGRPKLGPAVLIEPS